MTGTNPDPKVSKNEGFDTNDSQQNTLKSLATGTNGLILNHMAENEHKLNPSNQTATQNPQNDNEDIQNITTNGESIENTHTSPRYKDRDRYRP